jgi:hypothetical protein
MDRSNSSPLFRQSAEDLAARLTDYEADAAARAMRREALELATVFHGWEMQRPVNAVRIAAIQQLFDLNRRAMDYLSRHGRPAKPPSGSSPKK